VLSAGYHSRKRAELAAILGAEPPVILCGRMPAPLAIGIHFVILERFPDADPVALGRWLARWTNSEQYLRRLTLGGHRFDLDGRVAGDVSADAAEWARIKLKDRP
jgi:ProP effector